MPEDLTADVLNSPALPVLIALETAGVTIRMREGRVYLSPPERVTPAQREVLAAHATAVRLLVLIGTDEGVHARRDVYRRQIESGAEAATTPLLVFRSGIAYVPGLCYSCGNPLPRPRHGRCWQCALAARLACCAPVPEHLALAMDEARVA